MSKIYRNGDWNFYPIKKEDFEKTEGEKINEKDFTWAVGEASNHNHTAHASQIDKMKWVKMSDGSYCVHFEEDTRTTHPDHSQTVDLVIPAGYYRAYQRREKNWMSLAVKKIVD